MYNSNIVHVNFGTWFKRVLLVIVCVGAERAWVGTTLLCLLETEAVNYLKSQLSLRRASAITGV